MENNLNVQNKLVGTMAVAGLLFGIAYSAASLHSPLGLPFLTATVFGLGVVFGKVLKFKSKAKEVTI